MKQFLFSLTLLCACLSAFGQALVAPKELPSFAGIGASGTISSVIVSANGAGTPRIGYLNATGDNATNAFYFRMPSSTAIVNAAAATGQAVIRAQDGTITNNDIVIVRSISTDKYQRLIVSSATSTNFTATANLTVQALVVGDLVYNVGLLDDYVGKLTIGNATKEYNSSGGGGIFNGKAGLPILVDSTATTAGQLNVCSGFYQR